MKQSLLKHLIPLISIASCTTQCFESWSLMSAVPFRPLACRLSAPQPPVGMAAPGLTSQSCQRTYTAWITSPPVTCTEARRNFHPAKGKGQPRVIKAKYPLRDFPKRLPGWWGGYRKKWAKTIVHIRQNSTKPSDCDNWIILNAQEEPQAGNFCSLSVWPMPTPALTRAQPQGGNVLFAFISLYFFLFS